MFLISRKNISLNKSKPFENPFNIAKKTEFELITSRHFKNLISPKPAWNSQWKFLRGIKRLVTAYTSPIFQIFFQKKDFSENPVNLDVGI